jgi:hypothetical protein
VNSLETEITWDYPSANSLENDRYVTYNKKEKVWYFGALARTCRLDRGVFTLPMAVDPNGVIFEHEVGVLADEVSRNGSVYLLSGPAEIGKGDRVIYSTMMAPDVDPANAVTLTFKMKTAPQGTEDSYGPYNCTPDTSEGYVGIRVAGRQASMRVDQIADAEWTIGTVRLLAGQGGGR